MKTSAIISAAASLVIVAAGFALSAQAQTPADEVKPDVAAQPADQAAPAPAGPDQAGAKPSALTPEETAQAEDILSKQCTACHTADTYDSLHNEKAVWEGVMDQMAPNAGLSPAEKALVLKYLVAHYGPAA